MKRTAKPKRGALSRPQRRYRRYTRVVTALALLLFLLFNLLFQSWLGRDLAWDLSQNRIMSLGKISLSLVERLQEDIELVVLADEQEYRAAYPFMPQLLQAYVEAGKGRLSLRYEDPDANPALLGELDPEGYHALRKGKLVLYNPARARLRALGEGDLFETSADAEGKAQLSQLNAEAALSGAISYLSAERVPQVYRLTGHGEADWSEGYRRFKAFLDDNHFLPRDLNVLSGAAIPEDASLLMLVDPQRDLGEQEADRLLDYARRGGAFFVVVAYNRGSYPNLNRLLAYFNTGLSEDRVRENNPQMVLSGDPYSILASVPQSELVAAAVPNATLISSARALRVEPSTESTLRIYSLLETSEEGAQERGGDPATATVEERLPLVVAAERAAVSSATDAQLQDMPRLVLAASPSLFSDLTLNTFGEGSYNLPLMFAALNWLTEQTRPAELLIAAKPAPGYALPLRSLSPVYAAGAAAMLICPALLWLRAWRLHRRRRYL